VIRDFTDLFDFSVVVKQAVDSVRKPPVRSGCVPEVGLDTAEKTETRTANKILVYKVRKWRLVKDLTQTRTHYEARLDR
jgi:hypothetical protein